MIDLEKPFKLFTYEEADQLVKWAQEQELSQAKVEGYKIGYDLNIRNNFVVWFPLTLELKNRLWEVVRLYSSRVDWFEEPVQISRYSAGEFYDWHIDQYKMKRSSQRSLTLTCTLNQANDAIFETERQQYNLDRGEAVLFDSALRHRAVAPSNGERWSFTVWYMKRLNVEL